MNRLLTIDEAASYCGYTPEGYRAAVRRGVLPGPVEGTRRYDKALIDKCLNRKSGLDNDAPNPLREWELEDEGED